MIEACRGKKGIRLGLPLNLICLQRPKNTGDVPRSARSSAEREGRKEGGSSRGRVGQRRREEENSRSISELGKRAKRKAEPFSISQKDYMGHRAAVLSCVCPPLVSITTGGFGRGRGEEEKERPHGYLRLQRPLRVAPCFAFISRLDREKRETPTSKDSLISDVRRSTNLKEDLKKQLKGEYKGELSQMLNSEIWQS